MDDSSASIARLPRHRDVWDVATCRGDCVETLFRSQALNLWGEKAEMELAAMSLAVCDISQRAQRLRDVKHFATRAVLSRNLLDSSSPDFTDGELRWAALFSFVKLGSATTWAALWISMRTRERDTMGNHSSSGWTPQLETGFPKFDTRSSSSHMVPLGCFWLPHIRTNMFPVSESFAMKQIINRILVTWVSVKMMDPQLWPF